MRIIIIIIMLTFLLACSGQNCVTCSLEPEHKICGTIDLLYLNNGKEIFTFVLLETDNIGYNVKSPDNELMHDLQLSHGASVCLYYTEINKYTITIYDFK